MALLFLLAMQGTAAPREKEEKEVTFARMYCDYDRLIEGDSCLISFVVYASSPFRIIAAPTSPKVKNGGLRPWPLHRQRLQRVREKGGFYYALLVEQYVVHTKKVGELVVPPRQYTVELSVQQEYADPFDAFFAPPRKAKKIKLKGESEKFILPVVEKPMRTTRQMMKSGLEVI